MLGGCAAATKHPATRPSVVESNDPALLPFDRIQPTVTLDKRPATQPTTRPAVEALALFAQARDAILRGQRFTAVNALENALQLDPDRAELHQALGEAYLMGRTWDERSIEQMQEAARLDPDDLDLQTTLGRQLLAKGDDAAALERLRLAVQTTDYSKNGVDAAVADYFLAKALQQRGFDRAALERYAKLMTRAAAMAPSEIRSGELAFLLSDELRVEVGDLYARRGLHDAALEAYLPAADRDPDDFALHRRVVRTLMAAKRFDEAKARATQGVARFHADAESLELLHDACRAAGDPDGDLDALRTLHQRRPTDRIALFAVADALAGRGKLAEADDLLSRTGRAAVGDSELPRHRASLQIAGGQPLAAAKVLIEATAAHPEWAGELDDLWDDALSPRDGGQPLRLAMLRQVPVDPLEETAKQYAIWRTAGRLFRADAARAALERAASATPPFAPAYRDAMERLWQAGGDRDAKRRRADRLIEQAVAAPALAAELRGLAELYDGRSTRAIDAFQEAEKSGPLSADARLALATAFERTGQPRRAQAVLWKAISDFPRHPQLYVRLFSDLLEARDAGGLRQLLTLWRSAMPADATAQAHELMLEVQTGETAGLESRLSKLWDAAPDPAALAALRAYYTSAKQTGEFIDRLDALDRRSPGDLRVAATLADAYADGGDGINALRVLDAARQASAADADRLYPLSSVYSQLGAKIASRSVLEQTLELDPNHLPALNDLAYLLADEGSDPARAEALARRAAEGDPDNGAYLDTLGWVLYKRGAFAEAQTTLRRAIAALAKPDAVVLDHLGDALWRLGKKEEAAGQWDAAAAALGKKAAGVPDSEADALRSSLQRKIEAARRGDVPEVAPAGPTPASRPAGTLRAAP